MIPVRGPHQSEALGGCLVCLCLRPALKSQGHGQEIYAVKGLNVGDARE